jgi:hypothetical protein
MSLIADSMRALRLVHPAASAPLAAQPLSVDNVVRAAYRSVLRREPDPSGLKTYSEQLAARPERLEAVLSNLVRSDEAVRKNSTLLARLATSSGKPGAAGTATQFVSLGTHCFTSAFLKRQELKKWSGPFDWTFSSIPMLAHCIGDGFQTFLDPRFYVPIPVEKRVDGPEYNRVDHSFYRAEFGVRFVFNHHDVHLPKDYEYLQRCVARFKASLASTAPHVYVLNQRMTAQALPELLALSAAFQASGCRHRIVATLVEPTQAGLHIPQVQTLHDDALLRVHRFTPMSKWNPLHFDSIIDEFNLACLLLSSVRPVAANA